MDINEWLNAVLKEEGRIREMIFGRVPGAIKTSEPQLPLNEQLLILYFLK
jgi:hypothetical protein